MKRIYIVIGVFIALGAFAGPVRPGDTREQVLSKMGEPVGQGTLRGRECLIFQNGQVILENGRVVEIDLKSEEKSERPTSSVFGKSQSYCAQKYQLNTDSGVIARDKVSPIISLPGVETKTYKLNERWNIRIGFINGRASRVHYEKSYKPGEQLKIQDDEFTAILKAQSDGLKWEKATAKNIQQLFVNGMPGALNVWVRSDGIKAYVLGMSVRFDTPAVFDAEADNKAKIEQERQQSIPTF